MTIINVVYANMILMRSNNRLAEVKESNDPVNSTKLVRDSQLTVFDLSFQRLTHNNFYAILLIGKVELGKFGEYLI